MIAPVWPYLAVIVDSFRSALASRVLWAAMLAIWVLLAALAPLGVREDYTTSFRWFDLYNGTRMKALLAQGMVDPAEKDQPLGRLAAAMPDELQRKLQSVGEGDEVRIRISMLTDGLNELIDGDEDWYDAEAWKGTVRLRELRELDEQNQDELSESLRKRRARLRIEAALPGVFEARSARSVLLTYGTLDFPTGFSIDRAQFERLFNQFVIPTLVHWLLGFVLVFLGVLVTASIIPDMLQPGSLHLLLSKPITRWGLLLAKFVGGCAFVLLCVAQLVLGLYLIAGLRLGIWNPRILWCVPVSIILFAVFFSISVPAGLRWRSPIISIAAAGALAAICVVVGVIGGVFEARVVQTDQIDSLVMVGDDWLATTGGSGLVRYDESSNQWTELVPSEPMSNDRVLTPVPMDDDTILTAKIRGGRYNPFGSGALDLIALSRTDDWAVNPTLRLPNATEGLRRLPGNRLLAINTADLLVTSDATIRRELGDEDDDAKDTDNDETKPSRTARVAAGKGGGLGSWLRALTTLQGGGNDDFESILPSSLVLSPPTRLAISQRNRGGDGGGDDSETVLVLMTADRLTQLTSPNADADSSSSPWTRANELDFERMEADSPSVLAASPNWVVTVRGDGNMSIHDSADLAIAKTIELPETITPVRMMAMATRPNAFFVHTTQGHVHVLQIDRKDNDVTTTFASQLDVDDVRAMTMDSESTTLLLAHHVDTLAEFDVAAVIDDQVTRPSRMITPTLSFWRMVHRYGLGTLRTLTPQVLELGDTTAAMVSGEQSFVMQRNESSTAEVVRYRTKGPLLSCLGFIAVMLLMSCIYFARSDF